MVPQNNILSAATLWYDEAAKKLAAAANTIMRKSKEYGATMLSLEKKIEDLRLQIEPFAWAPDWVPVSEEFDSIRKQNAAAQVAPTSAAAAAPAAAATDAAGADALPLRRTPSASELTHACGCATHWTGETRGACRKTQGPRHLT
jgi:hypothetical protein